MFSSQTISHSLCAAESTEFFTDFSTRDCVGEHLLDLVGCRGFVLMMRFR
jgi:hypothetical protein